MKICRAFHRFQTFRRLQWCMTHLRSLSLRNKPCGSGHNNICFHSWIFGGIKTSGPGSWKGGCACGGYSSFNPILTVSTFDIAVSHLGRTGGGGGGGGEGGGRGGGGRKRREGEGGEGGWGGGGGGGGTVGSKLKGLTGWLLLWNVPLTAKTRPPTAACYRQVHGRGEAGGGWMGEKETGLLTWWGGKQASIRSPRTDKYINKQFGQRSSVERFKAVWPINLSRGVETLHHLKTAICRNNCSEIITQFKTTPGAYTLHKQALN